MVLVHIHLTDLMPEIEHCGTKHREHETEREERKAEAAIGGQKEMEGEGET
jgi:hypothetical protein